MFVQLFFSLNKIVTTKYVTTKNESRKCERLTVKCLVMMRNPLDVTGFMFLTVHEKSHDNYQSTCNLYSRKLVIKFVAYYLLK